MVSVHEILPSHSNLYIKQEVFYKCCWCETAHKEAGSSLTEFRAAVISSPEAGSFHTPVTTQHPHPPSPHIRLVPLRRGWVRIHSLRVTLGSVPVTVTCSLFRTKDISWTGATISYVLVHGIAQVIQSGSLDRPIETPWAIK